MHKEYEHVLAHTHTHTNTCTIDRHGGREKASQTQGAKNMDVGGYVYGNTCA